MALIINEEKCARCGVCESECPYAAIIQTEDAYMIDQALCTECARYGAPLCIAVCPNDGIHPAKESLYQKCLSLFN